VRDPLTRVLPHSPDNGLHDLTGLLGELHDPQQLLGLRRLRGLGGQTVEVHCACPAEVAHARYNARSRHEVHQGTLPLSAMDKYDRPVGIGPLITVDTTGPVDVAAVAAEVRRLHIS
jgi:hypothetical protein